MNELVAILDVTCAVILKLSAAFVLVAFGRFLLSLTKPQTSVWANSSQSTTGSTGGAYHLKWEPTPAKTITESKPQPVQTTAIECGNCHKEIKSAPRSNAMEDGKSVTEYVCEHCGMTVRLTA